MEYIVCILLVLLSGYMIQYVKRRRYAVRVLDRKYYVQNIYFWWFLAAFILIFFGSIRYKQGADFDSYVQIFEYIRDSKKQTFIHPFRTPWVEGGYAVFNAAVSCFTNNPQGIIFATCLVTAVCFMVSVSKESRYIPLSLFICMTAYFQSFTLVRQGMACAFLMMSVPLVKEKKWKCALFFMILALTFHKTSILYIVVIFISQIRLCREIYVSGAVLSGVLLVFRNQISYEIVRLTYPHFLNGDYYRVNMSDRPSTIDLAVCVVCTALALRLKNRILQDNKRNIIYLNLLYFFVLHTVFFWWFPFSFRFRIYFFTPMAFTIPMLFYYSVSGKQKSNLRLLFFTMILGIYLLNFTPLLGYAGYRTIFSG